MSALALDRQAVEKKDFPISRRGYEPEAVDAHLEAVAAELERLARELEQAQRAGGGGAAPVAATGVPSLASAASEQVRAIVEAAESSAATIEHSAEQHAAETRAEADAEARRVRDEAVGRSEDHVGRVGEAATGMLQRVDAMEAELGALFESLRTGTTRLTADLSVLHGSLGALHGPASVTAGGDAPGVPAASPAAVEEPAPTPAEPAPRTEIEPERPRPETVADEPPSVAAPAAPPSPAGRTAGDVDGARLIALNMALKGQSRTEADQYLRENFDLADRDTLLDEVYATVEG